jgi:serine/threonine protein kinase
MPIKFGPGEKIKSAIDTYVIENVLNQGAFAHAARAKSVARGGPVFLKRYFSPTRALDWYEEFVGHQQELKRRISLDPALSQYSYGFIDFFEGSEGRANKTFHQVFEFVEDGRSLTRYLADVAPEGTLAQWDRRVSFARVMMMGISALHAQNIVHTDLKPDNILLVPNRVRPDTYNLKLIDLDWAIFSDSTAPWHGKGVGYVGTHGYMSPEHLRGEVPDKNSDTFTCALMLSELLTGAHPFAGKLGDENLLKTAVLKGDFKPFKLPASIGKVDTPEHLEKLINEAMNPSPLDRPTSNEIKNALFGRKAPAEDRSAGPAPTPPATPAHKPDTATTIAPSTQLENRLELWLADTIALRVNIDTLVGRQMLKPVHADAQYLSDPQFQLQKSDSGEWTVSAIRDAVNETLVNGRKLEGSLRITDGMRIAVGNEAKGIEKLPLMVRLP